MRPHLSRAIIVTLAVIGAGSGCARNSDSRPHPAAQREWSGMSFNLDHFAYADRDGDGQPDEFKPGSDINAIAGGIASMRPHVVAVQEVGSAEALDQLQQEITAAGHAMPYADHLEPVDGGHGLGLLSCFPVIERLHETNLSYTIKNQAIPFSRGIQEIAVESDSGKRIHIMNVHLRSRDFHPAGQTEMRRNEARLLAAHIRSRQHHSSPAPLLVCGDFGDNQRSAALREIIEHPDLSLDPLPLSDPLGDTWTVRDPDEEIWRRQQFIFADAYWLPRFRPEKSGILSGLALASASRNRPLVAVFSEPD